MSTMFFLSLLLVKRCRCRGASFSENTALGCCGQETGQTIFVRRPSAKDSTRQTAWRPRARLNPGPRIKTARSVGGLLLSDSLSVSRWFVSVVSVVVSVCLLSVLVSIPRVADSVGLCQCCIGDQNESVVLSVLF